MIKIFINSKYEILLFIFVVFCSVNCILVIYVVDQYYISEREGGGQLTINLSLYVLLVELKYQVYLRMKFEKF